MQSVWAKRRQLVYGTVFVSVLTAILVVSILPFFKDEPTCFDGIQNQGETAPDKGGPCLLQDERLMQPLKVLWARSFPVRDNTAAAVAYVENVNPNAGVEMITYQFKLYTSDNFLIAEKFGRTPILPGMITPVIEPNLNTGKHKVAFTFFQFVDDPVWIKMKNPTEGLEIQNVRIQNASSTPEISAEIVNKNVMPKRKIVLTAVVFDDVGNAIGASRTFINKIGGNSTAEVVFTWPLPFEKKIGRVDIIPTMAPKIDKR